MSVGGQDNPPMNNQLIAGILRDISDRMVDQPPVRMVEHIMQDVAADNAGLAAPQPQPDPVDELNRFVYESSDDDSMSSEESTHELTDAQVNSILRIATITLIRNLEAYIRFERVDVHHVEDRLGQNATTAAMRYRLEAMEEMLEAFERNRLLRPRQLFRE